MSEQELIFSFLIGLMIVSVGAMVLSGLQWQRINREVRIATAMRRLRGTSQPHVTVLLHAYNESITLTQILYVLKNTKYRMFDVVVIDDASMDKSSETVREFMKKYPKAPIQLLRRRKKTTVDQALKAGYRKSQRGQIVLTLSPDLPIDTSFIKRAVASQEGRAKWRVAVRRRLSSTLRISDIGAFLNDYFWQQEPQGFAYEAATFKRSTPTLIGPSEQLRVARNIVAITLLAAVLLAAFLAVGVQVLWYSWVIITAYGLTAVWLRYGAPLRDRLVLSLSIPLALFLIPATSMVRGFSQLTSRK